MSQAAYKQGMLAWDGPTNYVIIISSGAFLLKIRLCQVLALQKNLDSRYSTEPPRSAQLVPDTLTPPYSKFNIIKPKKLIQYGATW